MDDGRQFGASSTAEEVTEGIDLTGQTWLITGVNSGLGYESARVLGLRGARIVSRRAGGPGCTRGAGRV